LNMSHSKDEVCTFALRRQWPFLPSRKSVS
jgi:hypothetical protein